MTSTPTSQAPTPRTDAACVSREYIAREMDSYAYKFVLADVARTLERELQARDAEIASARADQKAAWDTVRATHKAYEGERLLRQGLEAMNAELRKQLEGIGDKNHE